MTDAPNGNGGSPAHPGPSAADGSDPKGMLRDARALIRARASRQADPYAVGVAHLRAGDAQQAATAFGEAAALLPSAPWPLVGLGDARKMLGDRAAAVDAYDAALQRTPPQAAAVRVSIARSFEQVGELDRAAELYRPLLDSAEQGDGERPPEQAKAAREARSGLARVMVERGRRCFEEAADLLSGAELDPQDAALAEAVLDLAPRRPALYRTYAAALAKAGLIDRAVTVAQLALAHDRQDAEAALLVVELLTDRDGDAITPATVDAVLPLLDDLIERKRTARGDGSATAGELDLLVRRARLVDQRRPSAAAVDAWRAVVGAEPDSGLWNKELGDRLAELGRFDEAGAAYDRAVALGFEPF